MKRILIVTPGLSHGGTNRSLLNLLGVIDSEKYQVDVLAMRSVGPYSTIFSREHLLPPSNMLAIFFSFREALQGSGPLQAAGKFFTKLYMKFVLGSDQQKIFAAAARPYSKRRYDVVVGFQESLATQFASYIQTDYRIAWVHCDYSRRPGKNPEAETRFYEKYDRIVAVSRYTAQVFRQELPQVADRVTAIHNIMDQDTIRRQSREPVEDPRFVPAPFTLISVGRIDPVKRFPAIPAMAAQLKQKKIPFRWYILGDGDDQQELEALRQAIRREGVSEEVLPLGSKDNPYPYMKAASLVVCPSVSEAYPNVVNEGKILGVPVAATDFPSARELITPEENGIIVPLEEMGQALADLWEDPERYGRMQENLQHFDYENQAIYAAIEKLFDGDVT